MKLTRKLFKTTGHERDRRYKEMFKANNRAVKIALRALGGTERSKEHGQAAVAVWIGIALSVVSIVGVVILGIATLLKTH